MPVWHPSTQVEWLAYAAYVLRGRGVTAPTNSELQRVIVDHGGPNLTSKRMGDLRRDLKGSEKYVKQFGDVESIEDAANWVEHQFRPPLERLVEVFADRFCDDDARALAHATGLSVFGGNLCWLTAGYGLGAYAEEDVANTFLPCPGEPTVPFVQAPQSRLGAIRSWIEERLDPELAAMVDDFWRDRTDMGVNQVRTMVGGFVQHLEDHHGGELPRLSIHFIPSDWKRVKSFNNRRSDDHGFLAATDGYGWTKRALPLPTADGSIPSYCAAIVIVTGPDYLLLTQRPDSAHVEYVPDHWSVTIEENSQGPRVVREIPAGSTQDMATYKLGDASLHETARRGLSEELGLEGSDISSLLLLGLFAEAPFADTNGLFWATTPLPFSQIKERVRSAKDPEAKVLAREPLTTENLVGLCLLDSYDPAARLAANPSGVEFFSVSGRPPTTHRLHPSARARIFRYLLHAAPSHPPQQLLDAFETHGVR